MRFLSAFPDRGFEGVREDKLNLGGSMQVRIRGWDENLEDQGPRACRQVR